MNVEPKKIAIFINPQGENHHLKSVLEVLKGLSAQITILGHRESLPSYARFPSPERKARMEKALDQAAMSSSEEFAQYIRELGLQHDSTHLLSGRFPQCLSDWIEGADTDLLIKQSLPESSAFGFASKGDLKLTRISEVPVLLVNKPFEKASPVLVGIEPLVEDHSRDRFCLKLLNTACLWARLMGSKVHVVHAWQLWGEGLITHRVPQEEIQEALDEQEQGSRAAVDRIIRQCDSGGVEIESEVEKGVPETVLSAAIEKRNPGMVVLGSAAHEGVKKLFLGNTAENIIRGKDCSVLVLR